MCHASSSVIGGLNLRRRCGKKFSEPWVPTVALAASHHPQTDGQSERAIQTLSRLLRIYARGLPSRWEEMLPTIQFALNNAPASATRYSPFQVLFGRSPIMPADLLIGNNRNTPLSWDIDSSNSLRWVRRWWKTRRQVCSIVRQRLNQAAEIMKRRYNAKHKPLLLEESDLVLVSHRTHPPL